MNWFEFRFADGCIVRCEARNRLSAATIVQEFYGAEYFRSVLPRKWGMKK